MPIQMQWYCEGLVMYVEISGDITTADMIAYSNTLKQLVDSSDAPLVHMITDVSGITSHPSLREIMKYTKMPARLGWSLVIGMNTNAIVRFIAQAVSSALRLRYRELTSLDQALDFLQKMDSTLPDLYLF